MSASAYEQPASAAAVAVLHSAQEGNRITEVPARPAPTTTLSDISGASQFEADKLEVRIVRSVPELQQLEADWQLLADHALESNPFYEPYMVLPALKHLEGEPRPYFALVFCPHPSGRKGEKLLTGFFPLVEKPLGGFALPFVSLWKHGFCYLGTPLLLCSAARQTLTAFCDWLERTSVMNHAVLRLEDMCASGEFRQLLVDELHRRGWPSQVSHAYTRAIFNPAPTATEYLERALSGRRRKELRRLQSRLSETGKLEVTANDPLPVFTREFIELEARGWKGRSSVAVAAMERRQSHFEALCTEAASRGRLMTLTMRLDGKPIAMKMNLFGANGSFAFKITYDEQFAKFSPGVLLEIENIERLHALPKRTFMDSCAAPNRFMINHLWPDRREIQTVLITSNAVIPSLTLSLIPLVKWARDHGKEKVEQFREKYLGKAWAGLRRL
ncbi:MAG: GNAT family N-acetyltransferase [Myxococcaceae bacterium]